MERSIAKTGSTSPTMLTHQVQSFLPGPARLTTSDQLLTGSCAEVESGGQLNRHIPVGSWGSRPSGTPARLRQCHQRGSSARLHRSSHKLHALTTNIPARRGHFSFWELPDAR